ncbi:MAG: 8-amino-7-oxononanoate synthase [Brucellaceae bacterium]|jgi:8-amino-7-oxononanoate synthase|nr:8-amino-7-oxononanoate synthase [Brucellaceae bacterium]
MLMQPYTAILQRLESKGRLRSLNVPQGADFSSNDYLALAGSDYLRNIAREALERGVPVGSGGSRLLRGNHPEHEALEVEAAAFFKAPQVMYFTSGFDANQAVFATLPQAGDLVLYDALVHASIHAGMQAGKAKTQSIPHNDITAFETAIRNFRATEKSGNIWLAVESLYSMDGDFAPLTELSDLADRHGCFLYIDEAHATGVFGADGRGLAADLAGRDNVLILHTCGKALGASGALLCAAKPLIDVLINRARGFIFSTAPSPLQAAIVRGSLKALAAEPQRREKLHALIRHAGQYLQPSGSQIIPYLIGDNQRAVVMAKAMQNHGFDIRAIRPPTVPFGTARLRISITLNVDETQITRMAEVLKQIASSHE